MAARRAAALIQVYERNWGWWYGYYYAGGRLEGRGLFRAEVVLRERTACAEELIIVRWKGTTVKKNFGEEGPCDCIYIRSGGGLTPWQESGG